MTKSLRNCPKCHQPGLVTEFVVVRRETCTNCSYLSQTRITPIVEGGAVVLDCLVDHFLNDGVSNSALQTVLQRLLAKAQQHVAGIKINEGR